MKAISVGGKVSIGSFNAFEKNKKNKMERFSLTMLLNFSSKFI